MSEQTITTLYANGQKMYEENYLDGLLNGVFTHWYENSQKMSQEHYSAGKLSGLCRYWNDDGNLIYKMRIDN